MFHASFFKALLKLRPQKISSVGTVCIFVPPEVNILVNLWLQRLVVIQGLAKLTDDDTPIVRHSEVSLPFEVLGVGSGIPVQVDQIFGEFIHRFKVSDVDVRFLRRYLSAQFNKIFFELVILRGFVIFLKPMVTC